MPREGERVGRFEVVREIGRGGMAVVYLARQMDLDRDVALKQLGAFHATDPAAAARFLQESRITGSLGHPNIVTVHEYLQHEGVPYIAMEYLERGSLRPHVRDLTLAQMAGVLEGVLAALAHAADQGIVHRDLKPENLMLTRMGTVKVADFGIAKAVNEVQTSFATATGTTVGTPAYMSPEQAMARGVGPPTDLYAVGVMAYEMLVGRVPYTADTPIAVLLQHVNEPLPPPGEVKPDLDPDLAGWLESMLAKSPEDRPEDAAAAWDALEGIIIGILGPRWRREARLLDRGSVAVAEPLTPAPFESIQSPATPPPETRPREPVAPAAPAAPPPAPAPTGFETFGRQADQAPGPPAPPAPPAPAPPLAPAPTGFETFARPGAAAGEGPEVGPASAPVAEPPAAAPPADDGFRTFEPQPRAAPPPPPPPPPPPEPPAPAPAEPAPPAAEDEPVATEPAAEPIDQTVPPSSRDARPAEAPPAERGPMSPGRRRGLLLVGGGVVIAVIVAVVALAAGGGGGGETPAPPTPTQGTGPLAPDLVLTERPDLAASGAGLLLTDPAGRVMRLEDGSTAATLTDPASPSAVVADDDRVVVADGGGVTTLAPSDLRQVAAAGLPGTVALAAGGDGIVAAAAPRPDRGRACVVGTEALGPCAALDFPPTGLGAGGETFFAADGGAGQLVPLRLSGDSLTAGSPIPVGTAPHGRMVEDRGRLYVAVERGVAAVDLASGRSVGTFSTPTTPADLAIASDAGLLVAALPAGEEVAIIDTTKPEEAPRLVSVGGPPAALASTADGVQVVTTGGSLVLVDPVGGSAAPGVPVEGFGDPAPPAAELRRVTSARSGRKVTLTFTLGAGKLQSGDLRVTDRSIGDGRAAFELWQGGIGTRITRAQTAGVGVSVAPRAGRLVVALTATAERFSSLSARLVREGSAVAVVLTEPAPEPTPEPTPSPGPSPTPSPGPSPTPTPTPTPDPGFETG